MSSAINPIVLDSSVLVGYERMKTPGSQALHETQSWVGEWLTDGVPLLVPGLSLAVASHECGGVLPELDFLIHGDPDQVIVVPLAHESAVAVGATSASLHGETLEIAHVTWCARGGEDDQTFRWRVATYWPDWYTAAGVPVIAL